MKKTLTAVLLLAMLCGAAALEGAEKAKVDLCKGAVDPYETIGQKSLFFKPAGKDNEMTEKEFNADKAAGKGFVRSFEKWSTIVAFDKDGKKQIDWLEADAYRRSLRRRVLAAFDKTKDGKLVGEERTEANKALAAGKFASVASRRSGGDSRGRGGSPWERSDIIERYDTDKDGKLSEAEREAAMKAYRERRELQYYDKNKDGKLDEAETAARDKGRAEREKRQKAFMDNYDKNKNGKIDEEERDAIREYYRNRRYDTNNDGKIDESEAAARDKRRKEFYDRFDKNKNGQIDENERGAIGEYYRNREMMRRYDKNEDGKLDEAETAVRDKDNAEREKRRAEYRKRFDKDGDGKLNEEEERAYRGSFRRRGRGGRGGPGGGDRGGRGGGDRGGDR